MDFIALCISSKLCIYSLLYFQYIVVFIAGEGYTTTHLFRGRGRGGVQTRYYCEWKVSRKYKSFIANLYMGKFMKILCFRELDQKGENFFFVYERYFFVRLRLLINFHACELFSRFSFQLPFFDMWIWLQKPK